MNLTQEEITALEGTTNEAEWNGVCASIKNVRNGQYPPDWWAVMMMSGKADAIVKSWAK